MSLYQFLASDSKLLEVKNPHIKIMSINEALSSGLHVDESLLNNDIDRNDKSVIMYCDSEEHLYEVEIRKEESPCYAEYYSTKKYYSILSWRYSKNRAEQLIEYIKQHLDKASNIELWNIWMDEAKKPKVYYCKIDDLTVENIRSIWGQGGFETPECLIIEK